MSLPQRHVIRRAVAAPAVASRAVAPPRARPTTEALDEPATDPGFEPATRPARMPTPSPWDEAPTRAASRSRGTPVPEVSRARPLPAAEVSRARPLPAARVVSPPPAAPAPAPPAPAAAAPAIELPTELATPVYGLVRRLALQTELLAADRVLRVGLAELTDATVAMSRFVGDDGQPWALADQGDGGPGDAILAQIAAAGCQVANGHVLVQPIVAAGRTVALIILTRHERLAAFGAVERAVAMLVA
nr:hypothetical protein [Kofleriaceae bacterium]